MSLYPVLGKKDTRSGFGDAMSELGAQNPNIVALCADLTGSLKLNDFENKFPERFFQTGIGEANMIGLAAGLATDGKIPFTATFANFSTSRVFDQIRQSVCYSGKNVKLCASHAGLTLGEDGATHQVMEDIGMMKMLPHMSVVVPADYNQTKQATHAVAAWNGPVYLRFGRPSWPIFIPESMKFEIGKAQVLLEGSDVSIFACGHMVWEALQAAEKLREKGVHAEVINVHTIKPLDSETILESVAKTGCAVSAEEHQISGGLGESIASVLAQHAPAPMTMVGMKDEFGESGEPMALLAKYGLDAAHIERAARGVITRKGQGA